MPAAANTASKHCELWDVPETPVWLIRQVNKFNIKGMRKVCYVSFWTKSWFSLWWMWLYYKTSISEKWHLWFIDIKIQSRRPWNRNKWEREILKQKGNKKVRNFSCMELEKCKPDWTYLRASVKKVMRSVEDEMLESWTLLNYTHRQVGSILLKRLKWALTFRANIYIIVGERSIVVEYHLTCSTWLITSAVNLSLFHQCPSSSALWSSCLFCHSLIPSLLSLSPVSYWFDPVVSTNTQPGWTASQAYDAVKCQVPLGRRD